MYYYFQKCLFHSERKLKIMHEECGVFALYGDGKIENPAEYAYLAMFAMQHRGQQSSGIAVSNDGVIDCIKGMGLASEVFDDEKLSKLGGQNVMAHVNYSAKDANVLSAQPIVMRYGKGRLCVANNGSLVNAKELRNLLAQNGAMFRSNSDAELIAQIIAKERMFSHSIEEAVRITCENIKGAYSMVVMSPNKIVAVRDPHGFRPLALGKTAEGCYVVVSETCALNAIGADFVRDIEPGEILVIDGNGANTYYKHGGCKKSICIFEYIYFARPDSVMDGVSIHAARDRAGRLLARQHPVEADIVIGVPDSGLDAAIGYSRESGIEFGMGFVRNNYIGRTFIKPTQEQRASSVSIKLNVLAENIKGKRVVMVDDSIVRGTTCADIIRLLKNAGAKEVHVRISSPTIHYTCPYGMDIPTREELTSNKHSVQELCELIGADSLGFLSKDSLGEIIGVCDKCYCDACFTGDYPVE